MEPTKYDSNFASGPGLKNDLVPDLEISYRPPGDLKASKHQVRKVKPKHVARTVASIKKFGFCLPILIKGDEIVDGHVRIIAALELDLEKIPCVDIAHLTEDEIRLLRISVNKIQERGTWDDAVLKLEFAYQLEFNNDLSVTGFDAWEFDAVLQIGEAVENTDKVDESFQAPDTETSAVSQLGDLWCLGKNLVLCGNARSEQDLDKLVDGASVALCFLDPPYNVQIKGHVSSSGKHPEFHEACGELSSSGYEGFLVETLENAAKRLKKGGLLYAFIDWRHTNELSAALKRIGLDQIQQCVWFKDHPGMGSFYRSQYELIRIAKMPGASHCNNINLGAHGRNRSNVWQFAGATGGNKDDVDDFKSHPTSKPIRLVEEALLDVTGPGDIVLDTFLGSGSTLLAAERTKRRCLGLEISPGYVDLAIQRWQALTGEAAVHVDSGETFDERSQAQPNEIQSGEGEF